jgi:nitrite reductase/ring-hydroxylating ferredoxin subunit
MAWVTVARVSELTPGQGECIEVGGKVLAVFLVDGKGYAIDGVCPHRGALLHEGRCVGLEVVCPWHNSSFHLETGAHRNPPAKSGVKAYTVQIVGDEVQVDV